MRELIERFRYRFGLWRREKGEDLLGTPGIEPLKDSPDISHYRDPRNAAIITESTSQFVLRGAIVFLGVILIFGVIYAIIASLWPAAYHAAGIIMVILMGLWSIAFGFTMLDMCKARRMHRDEAEKEI